MLDNAKGWKKRLKLKTFLERIVKDIQRKWKCISKGKAHKKYVFGCKVAIVTTHKEGLCMSIEAMHKNPYDGHTLETVVNKAEKAIKLTQYW